MMNLGQNIWQSLGKGKGRMRTKKSPRPDWARGDPVEDMHGVLAAGRRIAAAVVVAATAFAHSAGTAAAGIDDQQNDDPAAVAPTKVTLITAHKRTSYEIVGRSTTSLHSMRQDEKRAPQSCAGDQSICSDGVGLGKDTGGKQLGPQSLRAAAESGLQGVVGDIDQLGP